MKACKSCGFPVPALKVGKGFSVFCPSCGASTASYFVESKAVEEWEQMNGEPELKPKKEKAKGKKG